MKISGILCMIIALLPSCFSYHVNGKPNVEFEQALEDILRKEYALKQRNRGNATQLLGLSWSSCSSAPAVVVKTLTVTPDKIKFGGQITVTANVDVTKPLAKPLKTTVHLEKKEWIAWITVPCIDNVGSCTYDDLCSMLPQPGSTCPAALQKLGLGCSCPFKAKSINVQGASLTLPAMSVPSGDYKVKVEVTENGAEVLCLDIDFSIA